MLANKTTDRLLRGLGLTRDRSMRLTHKCHRVNTTIDDKSKCRLSWGEGSKERREYLCSFFFLFFSPRKESDLNSSLDDFTPYLTWASMKPYVCTVLCLVPTSTQNDTFYEDVRAESKSLRRLFGLVTLLRNFSEANYKRANQEMFSAVVIWPTVTCTMVRNL